MIIISEETRKAMQDLLAEYKEGMQTDFVEPPYFIEVSIEKYRTYNKNYGDDRICKCGDPYYRHFDPYEDMEAVGCKYCECRIFQEKIDGPKSDLLGMFEKPKPSEHDCYIAVDSKGSATVVSSKPSLYENDLFNGTLLVDNITDDLHKIPTEPGVYRCKIFVLGIRSNTQEGIEYDMSTWIDEVTKIDILWKGN